MCACTNNGTINIKVNTMGKHKTVTKPLPSQALPVVQATTPAAPTVYTVVPPKRPLTGLKFGAQGNAATHAALAAAAQQNGGTLTATQAQAVCAAQSHKGFYSYAVNRLRILQPVVAAQA